MADDERDTTEPQPPAPRPPIRVALLAALEASGAWSRPAEAARELESVLRATLIGLVKLDARYLPWAVALVGQFNREIAEAVAAIAAPGDQRH
jgi:hypothetical protein